MKIMLNESDIKNAIIRHVAESLGKVSLSQRDVLLHNPEVSGKFVAEIIIEEAEL